jgi:hypothetical protein
VRSLEAQATRWTRYLALGAGWVLLGVAVLTVADALLRKFLSRPLPALSKRATALAASSSHVSTPGSPTGYVRKLLTGRLSARAQT